MAGDANRDLDLLWGAKEIAKAIGRTPRVTWAMLESGEIPARKIGNRWVIERSKLIAVFTGEAARWLSSRS